MSGRRFSPEDRARAVALADDYGNVRRAAREMGCSEASIHNWRTGTTHQQRGTRAATGATEEALPQVRCPACQCRITVTRETMRDKSSPPARSALSAHQEICPARKR